MYSENLNIYLFLIMSIVDIRENERISILMFSKENEKISKITFLNIVKLKKFQKNKNRLYNFYSFTISFNIKNNLTSKWVLLQNGIDMFHYSKDFDNIDYIFL